LWPEKHSPFSVIILVTRNVPAGSGVLAGFIR
jgi:hypothetical protein